MQPMQEGEKRRKRGDQGQDHQQVGRGPKPPRFLHWEPLREENFQRTMLRAWSRPAFMPQPFIQVHHTFPLQFPAAMYGPFGYVNPNAPVLP